MSINAKVIWSEGLFLQPQHLQQQDRYIENLILGLNDRSEVIPWGIIDFEIDRNLLSIGKLSFIRCKGIFPDGTFFNDNANSFLPDPIEIHLNLSGQVVYIALPIKKSGVPEVSINEDNLLFYRYKVENCEVLDNTTNSKNITDMQVGKLKLVIKIEGEDLGGFVYLPIAKVKDVLPDKRVYIDEQFIPSCLNINRINYLTSACKELLGVLQEAINKIMRLKIRISISENSNTNLLFLAMLNSSETKLKILIEKLVVHPETLYLYLAELMTNLATFSSELRPQHTQPYNHENLQSCFDPILKEIKRYLAFITYYNANNLELESLSYNIWVHRFNDKNIFNDSKFILGVKFEETQNNFYSEFNKFVKIDTEGNMSNLITYGLPGVDMKFLETIPAEIPIEDGYFYYILNTAHPQWVDIISSNNVAIYIGKDYQDLKIKLWAIIGDKNEW